MSDILVPSYQLAKRWSMMPRTLERWRWMGKGPTFVKVGNRILYRMSDIIAYENRGQHDRYTPPSVHPAAAMEAAP